MAETAPRRAVPDTDEPWYKDGLHFTCTQCGHCCTGDPGFVWLNDEEIAAIAGFLGEPLHVFEGAFTRKAKGKVTLREKANGDCVLYDKDRGCTVYSVRPRQCRTWPFWESNLKTEADWDRTERICPGSGEGELIPVEEIVKRLKVIKM
jgi:Fe-S-cluster containining protein